MIELESVTPSDKIKEVGMIDMSNEIETSFAGKIQGIVDVDWIFSNISVAGHIKKGKKSLKIEKYQYPKEFQMITSSGIGTNATWHFNFEGGLTRQGEYDLNIF